MAKGCHKSKRFCFLHHRNRKGEFASKGKGDRICISPGRQRRGRFCSL